MIFCGQKKGAAKTHCPTQINGKICVYNWILSGCALNMTRKRQCMLYGSHLIFHVGQDKTQRSQFLLNRLNIHKLTNFSAIYWDGLNVRGAALMSDNTSMLITIFFLIMGCIIHERSDGAGWRRAAINSIMESHHFSLNFCISWCFSQKKMTIIDLMGHSASARFFDSSFPVWLILRITVHRLRCSARHVYLSLFRNRLK